MRFHIDHDSGEIIAGWFVPDNPNATARIEVRLPGSDPVEFSAQIHRPDIVDLGMHNTGVVGFYVNETEVPGLTSAVGVELRDATSHTLFYKRLDPALHVQKRLMLFDASVVPQRKLLEQMKNRFAMPFSAVEGFPYETMASIVNIHYSPSLLLAGRPMFMRHANHLKEREFLVAALLRDPFEELAERLLFLNLVSKSSNAASLIPFATGLTPLIDLARDFPFADERAMDRILRDMETNQSDSVRDPLTRMLACQLDEKPSRNHVTQALENLAGMDVVGTRGRFDEFRGMIAAILGSDAFGGARPETSQVVLDLTRRLAGLRIVRDLLENDLALFSYAEEAVDIGLESDAAS